MWTDGAFLSLALHSTASASSHDPEDARVVAVALGFFHPAIGEPIVRDWLIDPGIAISAEATHDHGIDTAYVRTHGLKPRPALTDVYEMLTQQWGPERPLVVFDAPRVLTTLDRDFDRHHPGRTLEIRGPVIDTRCIALHTWRGPEQPPAHFNEVCAAQSVLPPKTRHVRDEARTAGELARAQAHAFPGSIGNLDPVQLTLHQRRWHHDFFTRVAEAMEQRVTTSPGATGLKMVNADALRSRATAWPMRARL